MLDQLPGELAALVVEHAVTTFRDADRTSVVHLAMTSKHIYNLVAPLLYRKVVITFPNATALSKYSEDPRTRLAAERVFCHTRELHLMDPRSDHLDFSLLRNLEDFSGEGEVAFAIARGLQSDDSGTLGSSSPAPSQHRRSSLRRLFFVSEYAEAIGIPYSVRETITHLSAVVPDESFGTYEALATNPTAWTMEIVDAYPNLTHLAFHFWWRNKLQRSSDHFDTGAVGKVTRAALACPRLQVVALRVSHDFLARWEDLLVELQAIEGSHDRIRIWSDTRDIGWTHIRLEDAHLGQSIWTEARPVATLIAAS